MKFCSQCGRPVTLAVPDDDNMARHVCNSCHTIHYQNPKIITGCVAEWQGKILLCKRAIEPRYGKWTLPAGFMECGETVQAGAVRETREEAQADVVDTSLYALYNIPHISHVYILFRGTVKQGLAAPGTESLETGFFGEAEIPWDELAFPINREIIQLYFKEHKQNQFSVHMGDIYRDADNKIQIRRA